MNKNVIRCIILGDVWVGKTHLFNILLNTEAKNNIYEPTIGVDVNMVKTKLNNGTDINLFLYDCSSPAKWLQIIKPYFYDSDIFIIVCDDAKYNSIKWARNILKIHLKRFINKNKFVVLVNNSSLEIKNPYQHKYDKILLDIIKEFNPLYLEATLKHYNHDTLLDKLDGVLTSIYEIKVNKIVRNIQKIKYEEINSSCWCF